VETLEAACKQHGFKLNEDFWSSRNNFEFIIDVSGNCNLACPSCPRGCSPRNSIKGFMNLELFEKILCKILIDSPNLLSISLFNWGEPFLNPSLAKMVEFLKNKQIFSVLSSNMSLESNFDGVLKANPDWLRISVSGYYQDVYATTHSGGHIDLVKSNMYRVRHLLDKYHLNTKIEVIYHKYLNNTGIDLEKIQRLCSELDFCLHTINARFMPVERLIDYYERKSVKHLDELLPLFIDKTKFETYNFDSRKAKHVCPYQTTQIVIDCNGKMQLCCSTYDDVNNFDMDYLNTSLEDIFAKKLTHEFCNKCKAYGLNP
jgi:MoaA/NifB/PqqE/SkfB family radical SAM enzyme